MLKLYLDENGDITADLNIVSWMFLSKKNPRKEQLGRFERQKFTINQNVLSRLKLLHQKGEISVFFFLFYKAWGPISRRLSLVYLYWVVYLYWELNMWSKTFIIFLDREAWVQSTIVSLWCYNMEHCLTDSAMSKMRFFRDYSLGKRSWPFCVHSEIYISIKLEREANKCWEL